MHTYVMKIPSYFGCHNYLLPCVCGNSSFPCSTLLHLRYLMFHSHSTHILVDGQDPVRLLGKLQLVCYYDNQFICLQQSTYTPVPWNGTEAWPI